VPTSSVPGEAFKGEPSQQWMLLRGVSITAVGVVIVAHGIWNLARSGRGFRTVAGPVVGNRELRETQAFMADAEYRGVDLSRAEVSAALAPARLWRGKAAVPVSPVSSSSGDHVRR
jgi:hypothetical protein